MPESVTLEVGGRTLVIETGELAKQANGSALIRYGEPMSCSAPPLPR